MASRGILCRCRSSCSTFRFSCRCSSASCSSCASLPSTSTATLNNFLTVSGPSSCGTFDSGNGSVTGDSENAGMTTSSRIRQLDQASVVAIGHAGWCCMTHWTKRLCTNLTEIYEIRKLLSANFGHQAFDTVQGQKTRRAPREWRTSPTELFSSAANGVRVAPEHRLSQWHGDQNGPLWFASSSRASPTTQSQGVHIRNLSTSATKEDLRRRLQEFTESDSQMEHTEEEDLDYYMKSRYNQGSLKSNETESEEELSTEPVQSEELEEDLLWKLKPNDQGKFENVLAVLGDPRVLAAAHERLNERRRNWTLASNELEVSHVPKDNRLLRSRDIDWNWFKEAAYLLRTGSYPFKPVKRLGIARRGRGEARQWVFVRPKDQVIQEAIRGILERIYKPMFSAHDSGFRPGMSVHSALKSVKYGWKGISWFLQFDVRITDNSSVEKRLLKLLAEQIDDEAFLGALRQMFKVGTIWIDSSTDEDKPEGSVLSPMLGNIYFHHLDLEISRIREEINCGSNN